MQVSSAADKLAENTNLHGAFSTQAFPHRPIVERQGLFFPTGLALIS
jgi:hypothetical protein